MRALLAVTALLLVAMFAPSSSAHGAPEPADVTTRLIADFVDDCGGDGAAATGSCRGSHDLIALDLQESWDAAAGESILQLKLWMDKAKTYPVTDTISMTTPAGTKSFTIQTSDDSRFTTSTPGFKVGGAQKISDPTRFTVSGTASLAGLGLSVGDRLSNFKVESKANGAAGDFMPGGCHQTAATDCIQTAGWTDTQCQCPYLRPNYVLRGPTYYASLQTPPETQQVPADGDAPLVMLQLGNLLTKSAQTVTLNLEGADGVDAGFHVGDPSGGAEYMSTIEISLAAKTGSVVHLNLHGTRAGASGTITITATTDLGGRVQAQLPYKVGQPGETASSTTDATSSATKSSPTPTMVLLGLALLAIASRRPQA